MFELIGESHSSNVDMWLDCGEHGKVPLSRITPTLVVAHSAVDIPPCTADLVIVVDGKMICHRVDVTTGFSPTRRAARVRPATGSAPF
jgi:hypothetical protein